MCEDSKGGGREENMKIEESRGTYTRGKEKRGMESKKKREGTRSILWGSEKYDIKLYF
jgi:hypothetical protein